MIETAQHEKQIELIRKAARGNSTAQRTLVEMCCSVALQATAAGDGNMAAAAYYEASIFARMAADKGKLNDRAALISILAVNGEIAAQNGDQEAADIFTGEALALTEIIAATDDRASGDMAARRGLEAAEQATPEALIWAKAFQKVWG